MPVNHRKQATLGTFVVQSLSCIQLFETPWTVAQQASLPSTIPWNLLKLTSIESVMLSHPLPPPYPFAFNLSQHQGLFTVSWLFTSGVQSTGASASVLPMKIQGSFPLRLTGLISLLSKGLSRVQHHNLKASILWCSAFFMVQLSHLYMTTGKIIALSIWAFVGRVMSLLFNSLSRFVIAFLPRSKCLISWL